MPIDVDSSIEVLTEEQFHRIAHDVMGVVFRVHNEYGRLLDEDVYQWNIRERCERAGICPARREVKIVVTHQDFQKLYYMDLLFANGLMIETKTAESLTDAHRAQALQYLMLTGMKHGLLVNMRTEKVEKEFVSTTLNIDERRRITVHESAWRPVNLGSIRLKDLFGKLIADWGAFLHVNLYRDAIAHSFTGETTGAMRVPIFDRDVQVGSHETILISDDTALALTARKGDRDPFHEHLLRFLKHTQLNYIQWINMDKHDIEFRTLAR